MIKAIIFDCFGVIVTDALSVLVSELEAKDPAKVAEMRAVVRAANRGIIPPEESSSQIADQLDMSVDEYREFIRNGEVRDQALLDYVKELRGHYKTGLLSNITGSGLARRFPNNELNDYFDSIVASSDVGYIKPEAEVYQIAADRLGVGLAECIFTDDNTEFCEGARRTGMQAIHYKDFSQFKSELTKLLDRS